MSQYWICLEAFANSSLDLLAMPRLEYGVSPQNGDDGHVKILALRLLGIGLLGVYMEEDFSLVYHIVNMIAQAWKFILKSKMCFVQTLSASFITKPVKKYQYFHMGGTAPRKQLEEELRG